MRCTQPYGLPTHAEEFLKRNAVRLNHCHHCKRYDGYKREVIGEYGMLGEFELYRYTLLDGTTADEYVQYTVWSSGPMIWLALIKWKDANFEWSEKEMDLELGEQNAN